MYVYYRDAEGMKPSLTSIDAFALMMSMVEILFGFNVAYRLGRDMGLRSKRGSVWIKSRTREEQHAILERFFTRRGREQRKLPDDSIDRIPGALMTLLMRGLKAEGNDIKDHTLLLELRRVMNEVCNEIMAQSDAKEAAQSASQDGLQNAGQDAPQDKVA